MLSRDELGDEVKNGNLAAVAIIIVIALAFTGWLIYKSSEGEDVQEIISPSPETEQEVEKKVLPDTTWLLDSLERFQREEEVQEIPKEKIASLSLSLLFSPFSYRFGFSSSLSLYGITVGAVYANDLYISLGYTFSF